MKNRILLTTISLLANFIMAGFAGQFGMLIEPIASTFHTTTDQAAASFSLLNGGALAGTLSAFFLIDIVGIRRITLLCYGLIAFATVLLHYTPELWVFQFAMALIGFCGGIGLCIAGSIVVAVWSGRVRSSLLLMQDIVFNAAGVLFPLITTWTLTRGLPWSTSYICVGLVCLILLVLVSITRFTPVSGTENSKGSSQSTEWNTGIFAAGLILFLSMVALYTFLTWAPLFISNKFSLPFSDAGNIITQYWSAALFGAVFSTLLISRIRVHYFLFIIITLAAVLTLFIVSIHDLTLIPFFVYGYGFACSALYNISIAFGVSFLQNASNKNVTFVLISGSAGAMLSPALSAAFHTRFGTQVIMNAVPVIYLIIIFILLTLLKSKTARNNN